MTFPPYFSYIVYRMSYYGRWFLLMLLRVPIYRSVVIFIFSWILDSVYLLYFLSDIRYTIHAIMVYLKILFSSCFILVRRLICLSSWLNLVFNQTFTISLANPEPITLPPKTKIFASLCSLAHRAVNSL